MTIKDTREFYGLTQIEVALLVDVPVRNLRRYELNNETLSLL